ncbi:hypothetical protein GJAV_G00123190 [Gymnothorax javanicus]|nr:hypothetical protein GJAV_G00123190 [Gymnothorax javanicus]
MDARHCDPSVRKTAGGPNRVTLQRNGDSESFFLYGPCYGRYTQGKEDAEKEVRNARECLVRALCYSEKRWLLTTPLEGFHVQEETAACGPKEKQPVLRQTGE